MQKMSRPESVTIDLSAAAANFQSMSAYNAFVQGQGAKAGSEFADHAGLMIRRTLTPEPLTQFAEASVTGRARYIGDITIAEAVAAAE